MGMLNRRNALLLLLPAGFGLAAVMNASSPAVAAPGSERPALDAAASVRLTVAPTGNAVRYRVREQLVGRDLPNDAVGETAAVSGSIVLDAAGRVLKDQSRITVDVTGLKSDSDRRDGYIQRRLLEGEQHPSVTLVPSEIHGIPGTIPTQGSGSLHLVADLTVKGVTRPTTWTVTTRYEGDRITGSASTAFTFDDFQLTQPRVPVLLSVADTIRLEYDFTLQRENLPD
jgi:polyisoprenoid-binding protein YceI